MTRLHVGVVPHYCVVSTNCNQCMWVSGRWRGGGGGGGEGHVTIVSQFAM